LAKTYGDVEGGEGVGLRPDTGYDQGDVDFKMGYFLAPRTKLTLPISTPNWTT